MRKSLEMNAEGIDVREKKRNLFPVAFTAWFIIELVLSTTLDDVLPIDLEQVSVAIDYALLALLLIQIIFFQEYLSKELLIVVLVTALMAISVLLSGENRMMGAWMFIVAFKNTDLDTAVSMAYRILRIMLPITILLCLVGLLPDVLIYRSDTLRHSMGFVHPNYLGMRIFQLAACYVYLHWQSLKKRDLIWAATIIAIIYWIPNSMTSLLCAVILFLLTILGRFLEKGQNALLEIFIRGLVITAFVCITVTVFLSLYGMDFSIWKKLDEWMSYRLSLAHKVYEIYGISLFGQKIGFNYLLDSGYLDILLRFGFAAYFLFFVGYIGSMVSHKRNTALCVVLCVFAFHGIMEYGVYMITGNIFLLSFADVIYSEH